MRSDKGISGKTIGLKGLRIGSVVAADRPTLTKADEGFLCGDGSGGLVYKSSTGTKTLTNTGAAHAVTDATDASSSTTGSLKTAGGLGVAKKAYVGTGVFSPKFKDATDASGVAADATTANLVAAGTTVVKTASNAFGVFSATTPVAQQSTTGTTTGFLSATGNAVLAGSTFTGGSGTKAYTIGDIVKALKAYGLLAAS